jgi:DNA modification methylase
MENTNHESGNSDRNVNADDLTVPADWLDPNRGALAVDQAVNRPRKEVLEAEIFELLQQEAAGAPHQFRLGDLLDQYTTAPVSGTVDGFLKQYGAELRKTYDLAKLRRRLWDFRATARAFLPQQRDQETPYTHFELARYQSQKFKDTEDRRIQTPQQCLDDIVAPDPRIMAQVSQIRGKEIKSLSQRRDSTLYMALKARGIVAEQKAAEAPPSPEMLACCHHFDVVGFAETLEDGTVKLVHLDPPYANYRHTADGAYNTAAAVTGRCECDNQSKDLALNVTLASIKAFAQKLTPDGVMILWQSAGTTRKEIIEVIEDSGLESRFEVIWAKPKSQPMNFNEPYGIDYEKYLVITHEGAKVEACENSSRSMVLGRCIGEDNQSINFQPIAQVPLDTHQFQKPLDLMQHLVKKHTYTGELVVDGFGCSGVMSIAAGLLGRRWHYVESNAANYAFGLERIAKTLAEKVEEAAA